LSFSPYCSPRSASPRPQFSSRPYDGGIAKYSGGLRRHALQHGAEFIAYAGKHPGKVTFSSSGVGTGTHLVAELFKTVAGIDVTEQGWRSSSALRGTCGHQPH
jgi:hypothetical protein